MVLHRVLVKATSQLISLPLLLRWVSQDTSCNLRQTLNVTGNSRAPRHVCQWIAGHCHAFLLGVLPLAWLFPAENMMSPMQVRVKDAQEHVSCVPAHASKEPAPEEDAAPQGAIVIRPETWTRVWASCVPTGTGALRVTDVVLRVGPDTALVWTLANFPAGQLHALPQHSFRCSKSEVSHFNTGGIPSRGDNLACIIWCCCIRDQTQPLSRRCVNSLQDGCIICVHAMPVQ